jgi:hypothetical protein
VVGSGTSGVEIAIEAAIVLAVGHAAGSHVVELALGA